MLSTLILSLTIQTARATGTIYIRADGSVDPSTAPILSLDNLTYTFTDNIYDCELQIQKESITVDGGNHTLQGLGAPDSCGISANGGVNVTIRNVNIKSFDYGIRLDGSLRCTVASSNITGQNVAGMYIRISSYNTVRDTNMTDNADGVLLRDSSHNNVSENDFTGNGHGIVLYKSPNNTISRNNIVANTDSGIRFHSSDNNTLSDNQVTGNAGYGIYLNSTSNNSVSRNNVTANDYGICLNYSSATSISENSITNSAVCGLLISFSHNNNVYGNNVTDGQYAIETYASHDSMFSYNSAAGNSYGIGISYSTNETLIYNAMKGNQNNFGVTGDALEDFLHSINTSNTVDDKTVYYLVNQSNTQVPQDGGYVALINCTEVAVSNLTLTNNQEGMMLAFTQDSQIINNTVSNNLEGIYLKESSNNTISGNNLTGNSLGIDFEGSSSNSILNNTIATGEWGIYVGASSNNNVSWNNVRNNAHIGIEISSSFNNILSENNIEGNDEGFVIVVSSSNILHGNSVEEGSYGFVILGSNENLIHGNTVQANNNGSYLESSQNNNIYHNNFCNNTDKQVYSVDSANFWDGSYNTGGNYWSDYKGIDEKWGHEHQYSGSDGIGDTAYLIDANNTDRYPLMKPYGGPHDIGIVNITVSRTVVPVGMTVNLSVKVQNYGFIDWELFNITFYVNTTLIAQHSNLKIWERSTKSDTLTWNTSGFARGCILSASVSSVDVVELDLNDNTFFFGAVNVTCMGDINGDYVTDAKDYQLVKRAIPSMPNSPKWNPNANMNDDLVVDAKDYQIVKNHIPSIFP